MRGRVRQPSDCSWSGSNRLSRYPGARSTLHQKYKSYIETLQLWVQVEDISAAICSMFSLFSACLSLSSLSLSLLLPPSPSPSLSLLLSLSLPLQAGSVSEEHQTGSGLEREIRPTDDRKPERHPTSQEHLLPVQGKGHIIARDLPGSDKAAGDEALRAAEADRRTKRHHSQGLCPGLTGSICN